MLDWQDDIDRDIDRVAWAAMGLALLWLMAKWGGLV